MHVAPAIFENVVSLAAENSMNYHSTIEAVYLGVLKTFAVLTTLALVIPDAIQCSLDSVQRFLIQTESEPCFYILTIISSLVGTVAFVGLTVAADIDVAVADEDALVVDAEIGALNVAASAAVIQVIEPLAKQVKHGDNQFDASDFVDPAVVLAPSVAEMVNQ